MATKTSPTDSHRTVDRLTPAEGRYLCGILYQTLVGRTPVSNRELNEYLDVSGASVTGMIETLESDGLVEYERYHGVELTDRGERLARAILWRRCAMQQYFDDELGLSLPDQQAYSIAFELDRDQVKVVGDRVDQPCDYHCEATDPDDCDVF